MATLCKIRIVRELNGVFPQYQPVMVFVPPKKHPTRNGRCHIGFCVMDIAGKKIIVRPGEYEMIEG